MGNEREPIKLRGHHISILAEYYLNKENPSEETKIIFDKIISNPEAFIQIVETLDSICEVSGCGEIKKRACVSDGGEDYPTRRLYLFNDGEITTSRELIRRIKIFKEKTGISSYRRISLCMVEGPTYDELKKIMQQSICSYEN